MKKIPIQTTFRDFSHELKRAQKGGETSLPYILNTIPSQPVLGEGAVCQVMAIGGTIFRCALVKNIKGIITVLSLKEETLPQFSTKEIFLQFIINNLDKTTTHLAINFAYQLQPVFRDDKLDGIFIEGAKGHLFSGLVGKLVGKAIEEFYSELTHKKLHVSLANDTVCLLLSGSSQENQETIAAGVIGTGVNFAFFGNKNTIVNLESACFDKLNPSEEGKLIDKASVNPHQHLFEKEVSGSYLYHHFNLIMKSKNIPHILLHTTKELSTLAEKNEGIQSEIARNLLKRSAYLNAAQIAGIAKIKKHPMTFIMQGSLFWNGYEYKQQVTKALKLLIPEYPIIFAHVDNADIRGAAKLYF